MIDPDLDEELTLANEFVLEALKADSNNSEISLVSQSTKPNYGAGLESSYGLYSENDLECFLQPKNEDQSLSSLDPTSNQLDNKGLFGCSTSDKTSYHLVPEIPVNENNRFSCCEKTVNDPCSLWNINSTYFPSPTVSCFIKSETTTSCYFSLPDIIDSMNRIDLLDSIQCISNELPFNIKDEPMEEDIRVDFLNLRDIYFRPDQSENAEHSIDDSILFVFLKTECKVGGVKVFMKELQDGLSTQCSQGPIFLPSEYNRRRGILSVDLNCLSRCLSPRSGEDSLEGISSFWQLIVKVQLEDGRSICHYSKSFQIRKKNKEYEDETKFKRKLRQIPVSRTDSSSFGDVSSMCFSTGIEEFSDSKPKSFALQDYQTSKFQVPCQNNVFSDEMTSDVVNPGSKRIILVPGSTLDITVISSKIKDENDIVSIQEQPNFTGLLKVMKANHLQDTSRRKANGYRSAEEAFVWACGHCFFSRGKKSTVKSHVSRQVCQKRRRLLSECIKEEKKVKPKFRRCHTFSGIQSKPFRNYNFKRCKTP